MTCRFVSLVSVSGALLISGDFARGGAPDFSREILPLLSENCFHCHGQDAKARKADLRLDVEAEAKKPIEGNFPILAGKSAQSEIMKRMLSTDPDDQMPPPKSNRKVTKEQVEMIGRWIDGGAKWGEHWAFTRVEKPKLPEVRDQKSEISNPIDAFVRAKLAEKGMKPAAQASPETLIRRVSLDLTGLPPTPVEVSAFASSFRLHPSSFEALVDRLLASPRHGERWVWEWLDASRYADSNGYQGDNDRTAWPWRDWVIKSINDNMPYDQFTIWQLAGDLLPNATKEQKLATAFVRNHMINGEGGRIPEENRIEYLFDQAETVGTVWLGLTLQCTRCHDHKFDPLTMNDYYSLVAFFNSTPVDGQGRGGQTPPVLDMSTPGEEAKSAEAQKKVNQVAKEVEAFEVKKWQRPAGKGLEESDAVKLPGNLPSYIAKTEPVKRGVDPLLESINYFKEKDKAYADVLQKLMDAVRKRDAAKNNVTKVMVMEERKEGPRDTFLLGKGAYDNVTTTKVSATTPGKLPPMPAGARQNRLGLAQWLVSRDNPLTARVTVNRYWQSLFGIGLVKTAEDFGVQGERPLHMDLLDFLAADFMDHGWDVKRLIKMIVMSETYRQSSRVEPGAWSMDPENRFLSRGPRFRLPSFMLRDQALAISGLLSEIRGGPAVKPYQPEGIWEEASFGKIKYSPGTGTDLYRRSLYTFWRRIVGPTMVFDNATRQTCVVKADRTNTPLHALTTMNETTFVECARVLAQRLLTDATLRDDAARFDLAWSLAMARKPTTKENQTLAATLDKLRARFARTLEDAKALLAVGDSRRDEKLSVTEHAAWTSICLTILNLDEVLNKE
jgi:Protein of unknown function (DUF1553)/Protein of unknown function (DUF1549)/Planctomycete cytochrome C